MYVVTCNILYDVVSFNYIFSVNLPFKEMFSSYIYFYLGIPLRRKQRSKGPIEHIFIWFEFQQQGYEILMCKLQLKDKPDI